MCVGCKSLVGMSELVDNAPADEDRLRQEFCEWLQANGARYPKILWPSNETESGSRGAIALEDIATGEHMLEIPMKLMLSPPNAFADPDIGEALLANEKSVLHGDLLITVFVMHELRKGTASFYSPFLRILPEPGNISEWGDADLRQLQDQPLSLRAKNGMHAIKTMYNRTIPALNKQYPDKFPLEEFTFERFKFAWNSIQARAFGRRLPWTAMVPFADCLNHTNVQTKYDYNVDGNGLFRLFPTGSNHYPKGSEVFNSYGRRANDNLLLDYGFSILDNEWDDIELCLGLPDEDPHRRLRVHALSLVGFQPHRIFRIHSREVPFSAMMFLRIALMDAKTLQHIVDELDPQEEVVIPAKASARQEGAAGEEQQQGKAHEKKVVRIRDDDGPRPKVSAESKTWFSKIISAHHEHKVLDTLRSLLLSLLGEHATSVLQDRVILRRLDQIRRSATTAMKKGGCKEGEDSLATALDGMRVAEATEEPVPMMEHLKEEDVALLSTIAPDSDAYWRLLNAVNYRLTRKHILLMTLGRVDQLMTYFSVVKEMRIEDADDAEDDDDTTHTDLWEEYVQDDTLAVQRDSPRRAPGADYLRAYRRYKWEATNPLVWPDFEDEA